MPGIRVTIRGRKRPVAKTVKYLSASVEGVLEEMRINPQDVLVRLNGEFVPDTHRVMKGDRLELIEITSRG